MNLYLKREYNIEKPEFFNNLRWPRSKRVLRIEIRGWSGRVKDTIDICKSDLEWLLEDEVQKD